METYICKTIDDFHRCQLELLKKGYKWYTSNIINDYGYLDLRKTHYYKNKELSPTFQLYTDNKVMMGWDDDSNISCSDTKIKIYTNREEKLKRILNESN